MLNLWPSFKNQCIQVFLFALYECSLFNTNLGFTNRLQGFCLTLSRLPTSRRRFFEVVRAIEQEARNSAGIGGEHDIEAVI